MASPLVTIITPTVNHERYVAACAQSVLAQGYARWEQVFVDDGSTDRTREIVEAFGDPRQRVLSLPHRGLPALAESYNAALAVSHGSLVAILEGDDLWPADKLARQVPSFDDPEVLLSWGRADTVDDEGRRNGARTSVFSRDRTVRYSTSAAFQRLTRSNLFAPSVSVMIRRSALDAIGGFRQWGSDLFVDLPTWLHLTAAQPGVVEFVNHVLGTYRVHAGQTTRRAGVAMTRQHLESLLHTVTQLDADTLARAGWSPALRARALTRGEIAEGEGLLATRQFAAALSAFRKAAQNARDTGDRLLAVGGMLSALLHLDLVRPAFAVRAVVLEALRRD
jgi:hypothetical protein